MVERFKTNKRVIEEVTKIYAWLDSQINERLSTKCDACGKCCDFEKFGHRLFVTMPELTYMAANLKADTLEPMMQGRCPYNINGKCSVYNYRFSGCRIFNCKANTDIQSELSELTLKKLKQIHVEFQISYRYIDLATALNNNV